MEDGGQGETEDRDRGQKTEAQEETEDTGALTEIGIRQGGGQVSLSLDWTKGRAAGAPQHGWAGRAVQSPGRPGHHACTLGPPLGAPGQTQLHCPIDPAGPQAAVHPPGPLQVRDPNHFHLTRSPFVRGAVSTPPCDGSTVLAAARALGRSPRGAAVLCLLESMAGKGAWVQSLGGSCCRGPPAAVFARLGWRPAGVWAGGLLVPRGGAEAQRRPQQGKGAVTFTAQGQDESCYD